MKFAHMADLHLGATSDQRLREFECKVLEDSFKHCIEECVDFVIIAGDLFHVNIPDLMVVRDVAVVFRKFIDTGRKIYVVYGSHDFSPNATSIIDILEVSGLIVRVGKPQIEGGLLRPSAIRDVKSGAVLTGISGRRTSLEKEAFERLDRDYLDKLEGFKIFVFHTGLDEIRREDERFEGVSIKELPPGFDYYAGGHIHRKMDLKKDKRIVYPGPLFTGWGADLEGTANGEERGFYIVDVDSEHEIETRFKNMMPFEGILKKVNAAGYSAAEINKQLMDVANDSKIRGKLLVLKVFGELSTGKTSDIDFVSIKDAIMKNGAIYLHLNRHQLKSREVRQVTVNGENTAEIEEGVLKELAGTVRISDERLRSGSVDIAKQLLAQLRSPKIEGETGESYESRIKANVKEILGIKELI